MGFDYVDVTYPISEGKYAKWRRINKNELWNWIQANPEKAAYFSTIQAFENPAKVQGEGHWCPLYFDLDAEVFDDALADTRRLVEYFSARHAVVPDIWYSGNRGFHITVDGLAFGAEPSACLTKQYKFLVSELVLQIGIKSCDLSVYTTPRMWRVEGTEHPKSGLYKVPLSFEEVMEAAGEQIKELARESRELPRREKFDCIESLVGLFQRARQRYEDSLKRYESTSEVDYEFRDVPPCIQWLLDNSLPEIGTKNRADMLLSSYLKSSGQNLHAAQQIISDWAARIPDAMSSHPNAKSRMMESIAILKTVYGDVKYKFSCSFVRALLTDSHCQGCQIEEKKIKKVSLYAYAKAENLGQKIQVEADAIGRDTKEMIIPTVINAHCVPEPDSKACISCSMGDYFNARAGRCERTIKFDASEPRLLEILDASIPSIHHRVKRIFHVAERCYEFKWDAEYGNAQYVYLASRITNDFRLEEQISRVKVLVLEHGLKLNQGYIVTGVVHTHPRTQAAILVVDQVEQLQSSLETFSLTPEELEELKVFQCSNGTKPMEKVRQINAALINDFLFVFGRAELVMAVDLIFHSARRIPFQKRTIKGWLDVLIIGDTGQAKTETVKRLMQHYNLGAVAAGDSASRTGLLYNIQMTAGEDAWVSFGLLCRANGMLVCVDEAHEMPASDFREFTQARSEGIVDVKRYAYGQAQAETRLILLSNPKSGMGMGSYGYAVQAIPDVPTFRSREDIRRFDFAIGLRAGDVTDSAINQDVFALHPDVKYDGRLCKNLILWMWTRQPEQIKISHEVELYILDKAQNISLEYVPEIPLIESADVRNKILRIATAFAGRTYSTEDGVNLIVGKEHVDAALEFLDWVYHLPGLDYWGYSDDNAQLELSPEALRALKVQFTTQFMMWKEIARWLIRSTQFSKSLMRTTLSLDKDLIDDLQAFLLNNKFVEMSNSGNYKKTPTGRKFFFDLITAKENKEKEDEL